MEQYTVNQPVSANSFNHSLVSSLHLDAFNHSLAALFFILAPSIILQHLLASSLFLDSSNLSLLFFYELCVQIGQLQKLVLKNHERYQKIQVIISNCCTVPKLQQLPRGLPPPVREPSKIILNWGTTQSHVALTSLVASKAFQQGFKRESLQNSQIKNCILCLIHNQ